jgi:hypothetical protein
MANPNHLRPQQMDTLLSVPQEQLAQLMDICERGFTTKAGRCNASDCYLVSTGRTSVPGYKC